MRNPFVLAFSAGAFLYVGVEAAVYVWMPTLLAGYTGAATSLAAYSISVFSLLRAAGRFLGAWMLTRVRCNSKGISCLSKSEHGAALLFVGLLLNWLLNPTRAVLEQLDITDYRQGISTDEPSRVLTSCPAHTVTHGSSVLL